MNLRKTKWLLCGTYRPPSQSADHFFKQTGYASDFYTALETNGFNSEDSELCLPKFLITYDSENFENKKTCLKNPENPETAL